MQTPVSSESQEERRQLTPRALIKRTLQIARRALLYWPALAVAATLAIGAFFLVPKLIPPVYESGTVLLYREVIQADTLLGSNSTPSESKRARNMRLREMLLSRSNLKPIIEKYQLYPKTVESQGMVEGLEEMRLNTKCQVGEGDTVTITYQGDSAETVFEVTKALADSMVEQARKYRAEEAEGTQNFLQAQLETTGKELKAQEQALAKFLAIHPEFALETSMGPTTTGAAVRASRADTLAASGTSARPTDPVTTLRRHAERLQRRIKEAENPGTAPVAPPEPARLDPASEAAIQSAESSVARARENLSDKQAHYTAKHPDVVAAQAQLSAALAQLATAKANAKTITPKAVAAAPPTTAEDINKLRKELAQVEASLARASRGSTGSPTKDVEADAEATTESNSIVALETEWTSLNRDVNAARDRNEAIERQLFRASIVAKVETSGGGSQVVVIDEAYEPKRPTRRGAKRTGAVAFAAVMVLGALAAVALAFLDDRVYDELDIRNLELGPIAHVIPADNAKGQS
ncbi:MAG: hypothetical protein H6718_18370 [Polyangiaceae bacterium]|nr:hypothetical protein [Polyangiaceae bacterium]MCB9605831.1 hypothetical protein [Polyangiaceae bacterium]